LLSIQVRKGVHNQALGAAEAEAFDQYENLETLFLRLS
jgi:hypothetical protein